MENERGTKMKKVVKLLAILMILLPTITTPVTVLARGGGARTGGARTGGARSGGARSGGSKSGGSKSGGSKSGGSKSGDSKSGDSKSSGSKSSGSKSSDSKSGGSESSGSKSSGSKSSENNTTNPKTETPKLKTETPKSSWTPPVANFNNGNFNGNSLSQPFTQPAHRSWSDNLLLWYALFHNNGPRTTNVYNTNPLGTNNNDWSNTSQPIGPTQQNYIQNNEDVEKKEKTDWKKIASIGALIGLPLILTALIFVFKR